MKVLVATHSFGYNGAARVLRQLLRHWSSGLHWEVHVLASEAQRAAAGPSLEDDGLKVLSDVDPCDRYDFLLINTLLDAHRAERFKGRMPIVLWVHEGATIVHSWTGTPRELIRLFGLPDLLVFQTPWQPEFVFRSFLMGVSPERIRVIPCAVSGFDMKGAGAREQYQDRFHVVSVGSVYARKRPLDLAGAVLRLVGQVDVRATFIGDLAHAETTVLGSQFWSFSRQYPDRLKWVGALARAKLHDVVASADAGCFPSGDETFGIAALELATLGIPIVLADLPVYDFVGWRDGVNCLRYPVGDVEELARCLARLAHSPALSKSLGTEGQRLASLYPEARFASEMTEAVTRLLA